MVDEGDTTEKITAIRRRQLAARLQRQAVRMQHFLDNQIRGTTFALIYTAHPIRPEPLYEFDVNVEMLELIDGLWKMMINEFRLVSDILATGNKKKTLALRIQRILSLRARARAAIHIEARVHRATAPSTSTEALEAVAIAIGVSRTGGPNLLATTHRKLGHGPEHSDVQFMSKRLVAAFEGHDAQARAYWDHFGRQVREALLPLITSYHEQRMNAIKRVVSDCDDLIATLESIN